MKLKKYEKNPIIAPNPANAWENLVTCNPGVIYDDGRFYMLYRAAGDDKEHVIRLGLAVSENGFDFRRVGNSPVFGPSADGPDGGCVEDPRIVKFDNEFYITYAYRAHAPGQYWTFAHDVVRLPRCGAYAPAAMAQNLGNPGLAVTTDFRNFRRLGRLTSPVLDDRDVILFPEKIGGKFAMMHRPKQFVGVHIVAGYDAERSTQPDRFHQIPRVLKLQRLADIIEILHGINRILVHVGGHPQHQFQQLCNGGIRNFPTFPLPYGLLQLPYGKSSFMCFHSIYILNCFKNCCKGIPLYPYSSYPLYGYGIYIFLYN